MANIYGKTVGGLLSEAAGNAYNTVYGIGAHMANNPKTAGLLAGQFVPGAATADFYGRYPDPMNPSQTLPSAGQNLARGQYLDAALQSAGLVGDIFYSAAPYTAGAAAVPGAALSAPRAAQLAKRAADAADSAAEPSIIAYHGSPYDFDNFNLQKINTGEGVQAYGDGLYFTDSEDIARHYRDTVSFNKQMQGLQPIKYKGQYLDNVEGLSSAEKDEISEVIYLIQAKGYDPESALEKRKDVLKGELAKIDLDGDVDLGDGETINGLRKKSVEASLAASISLKPKDFEVDKGKIYKVGLAPKPEQLLDFDKPLGEQSEFVKKRLIKVADEVDLNDAINLGFDPSDFGGNEQAAIKAARQSMLDVDTPVGNYLGTWASLRGFENAGEELLSEHGVKGLKYKAGQLTKNMDDAPPATNYVIFDDKLIKILEKYGIFGPVAVGAATTAGVSGLLDDEPKTGGGLL